MINEHIKDRLAEVRTMTTTKINNTTLEGVKRLSKESIEGFNQTQIIAEAVREYARNRGMLQTKAGFVMIGDEIGTGYGKGKIVDIVGDEAITRIGKKEFTHKSIDIKVLYAK